MNEVDMNIPANNEETNIILDKFYRKAIRCVNIFALLVSSITILQLISKCKFNQINYDHYQIISVIFIISTGFQILSFIFNQILICIKNRDNMRNAENDI